MCVCVCVWKNFRRASVFSGKVIYEHVVRALHFRYGSWTYDGFRLELQLRDDGGISLSEYSGPMTVYNHTATVHTRYYACCPEPYHDIAVRLELGLHSRLH